jgi:urea transport system permease protein
VILFRSAGGRTIGFWQLVFFGALWLASPARALTADEARALAIGESDERAAAIAKAALGGDPQAAAFLQALLDDTVKTAGERVFVMRGDKSVEAASGTPASLPDGAEDVVNSNRIRRELEAALAGFKLLSADAAQRAAVIKALRDEPDESRLPLI